MVSYLCLTSFFPLVEKDFFFWWGSGNSAISRPWPRGRISPNASEREGHSRKMSVILQ